ncbi:MAG: response regulator transcription factor [Melioribacteraceae bacterium]|nr:response regulator transcription factor [Melioribacteraceae bacterium]MCF8395509.1 response regulator transcription factor [Melioribacteraceae bacterium]MCF8420849.1 response regulator transcription factor [Melioribacteraceae bacterium]
MTELTKISIVEDNEFARNALSDLLSQEKDFVLLGSYDSCETAFDETDFLNSDVVLVDINLPGINGIVGTEKIKNKNPKVNVIMLTINDDDENVFAALKAGAVGYLLKSEEPGKVIDSVREVLNGGSPMSPYIARKVLKSFHSFDVKSREYDELNEMETKILNLLSEGKSYNKIADEIFLSSHGVKYHIRNIYLKLRVNTKSEAISKGHKFRIIKK